MDPTPRPALRPTADDRRRGDRHRLDVPATLAPADGATGPDVAATVVAFSVNGVGLRLRTPLAVGTTYTVSSFDTLLPPGLRVRVKTQRIAPNGNHEVGAEVVG